MASAFVSVIVPTYNRLALLELTLKSILGQTYKNFEIIVVDDGSPGDATEILCKNLPKVRYVKIENSGGPAKPRNVGISKAKGNYIAFVDDDDIWFSEKLEKQVEILEANPDFGLAHCYCKVIDENGNLTDKIVGKTGTPDVKHGKVTTRMMGNWTLMMPTPLVRKSVINAVGEFNETIPPALEDVEYWNRCSFHANFYYIDEALVYYRVHSGNISADRKRYIDLPLYLLKVVKEKKKAHLITSEEYELLVNNLSIMQLRMLQIDYFKSLSNLFKMDSFWFLNLRNMKTFINKVIQKKQLGNL